MRLQEENLYLRRARKEHFCAGRIFRDRHAVGWSCKGVPISRGDQYVEYVGETPTFQSGVRYHVECALREGWEIRPEEGPTA